MHRISRKDSAIRAIRQRSERVRKSTLREPDGDADDSASIFSGEHLTAEDSEDSETRISLLDLEDALSELGDALDRAGVAAKSG